MANREASPKQWHVRYRRFHSVSKKERQRAEARARGALRRGDLVALHCEVPGCLSEPHMHHEDYSRPLEVRWLCPQHHYDVHDGWDVDQLVPVTPEEIERARRAVADVMLCFAERVFS